MEMRNLPSVTELMASLEPAGWAREITANVARWAIDRARQAMQEGRTADAAALATAELNRIGKTRPSRVINAGGVLLNTNLGRAPVHDRAVKAAAAALGEYGNVEFDLGAGRRGGRGAYVHRLVADLTGAEAALVVNNNAGALFLTLAALGTGRQVVISRGELIEIGGSFRLPDLMAAAGVWLIEVGTTNRTRRADYEEAIRAETAMVLKVHPSNYRTVGFTEEAEYQSLAELAHRHHLPFIADIGSGLLDAAVPWIPGPPPAWLQGEPAARQTLADGADLVMFSGDKLLGGPQAGIIAGNRDLIERLGRHPIARGLRCGGPTLAALAATLELYADGRGAEIPFWSMAAIPAADLETRSVACLDQSGVGGEVVGGESVVGAGSVPGQSIPSPVIRISGVDADTAWHRLLAEEPAVIARRRDGDLIIDLRAVTPDQDAAVAAALAPGMPIVGTAGHVDHGKSTLIRALTGRDPDRLAEEKARGLTIDLGFAWTALPSGASVGFVDVPGHERFIKNMLAGIDAVNIGLLVVAADEGWMPQSEEHLAILDLLEVPRLIVVLTRTALVDDETRDLAEAEVVDQVTGTVAENSPIVAVDSLTGEGLEALVSCLEEAVAATSVPDIGRPRLWVDRSFSISGAGTVVTGTLLDGALAVGEEVAILPGGATSRIRGIQSHEQSHDRVDPGTRTALNLIGLDTAAVGRGAMLGRSEEWAPSRRTLVALRTVRRLSIPIKDRGAYHLHVGSGSWPARLRLLDGSELIGPGHAVLTTADPIPLAMGDRFILREVGRREVVAGGRILEPEPPARVRSVDLAALEDLLDAAPDAQATGVLASRGTAAITALSAHTRGGIAPHAIVGGRWALDPHEAARLTTRAVSTVERYQTVNPLRAGMPKASLASQLDIDLEVLDALLGRTDLLTESGTEVATSGFKVELDPAQRAAWDSARARLQEGLTVPTLGELGLSTELVYALIRAGSLVRISGDLVILPEQAAEVVAGLVELPADFTVAAFRDHFGLTRKYAVPLLEWLDSEGHTVRRGDGRTPTAK